jgi:hypothetical protein
MTPDDLKDWIRVYAAEILTVNLYATSLLRTDDPLGLASELRQQMVQGARIRGFPGLDPAMSDLASAELEGALDRLMRMVSEQINVALQARKG